MITWQALKLSGGDGVSVSASTQSSPTEREKPGEAPQITISIKTTSTRKRKIDGPEDKGSTSASAVLPPQTPWPCARCNLEPIDTVWRPLDGTTAFDTEERICGACWLVEDENQEAAFEKAWREEAQPDSKGEPFYCELYPHCGCDPAKGRVAMLDTPYAMLE